jgi:hypothetical protein
MRGFRTAEAPAESVTVIVASYRPGATHAPLSARPFQVKTTWPDGCEEVVNVRNTEPDERFLNWPVNVTERPWNVVTVMVKVSPPVTVGAAAGLNIADEMVTFETAGAVP